MSAKAIMIQGTMSNAGKSFVAAGLCRVFYQDGYRTAPFKSQNMALNSYITEEGMEMGRAQVMQAEAAGIKPSVRMNPILLKPTSQMGSQVIVNGEVYKNMKAMDYYKDKPRFIPAIMEAYHSLEEEFDVLVLEGAGSPAEINLKDNDIVNMGMAKLAKAPVLLVADIDRGGVFASIYGTIMLLPPQERRMIKGVIINKFRGDVKILEPGLKMIEDLTGIPVVGVIPMEKLDLDDEDSLSDRLTTAKEERKEEDVLDIVVVRLPHISNFTDFAPLERLSGVSLRYEDKPERMMDADLLLLPGTKNTLDDLRWLSDTGWKDKILKEYRERKETDHPLCVMGICGGYQLMGEEISDPEGVEGGGSLSGLSLLPVDTIFTESKTRTRIGGKTVSGEEIPVNGYEIHMGKSRLKGGEPLFILEDGREDGCVCQGGLLLGTYLHGIFDNSRWTKDFLEGLCRRLGRNGDGMLAGFEDSLMIKEREYDRLADLVRRSLPMERIYQILEDGIGED